MAIFIFRDYHEPERTAARKPQAAAPSASAPKTRSSKPPSAQPPVPQIFTGELTPRQMAVFRQMLAYQDEHGQPPTQAELSAALGMKSEQGVKAHLSVLEARGYVVTTQKNGHRNKMAVWPEGDGGV
jgi:biotin operon repressor